MIRKSLGHWRCNSPGAQLRIQVYIEFLSRRIEEAKNAPETGTVYQLASAIDSYEQLDISCEKGIKRRSIAQVPSLGFAVLQD